jgi:hypothetical protein
MPKLKLSQFWTVGDPSSESVCPSDISPFFVPHYSLYYFFSVPALGLVISLRILVLLKGEWYSETKILVFSVFSLFLEGCHCSQTFIGYPHIHTFIYLYVESHAFILKASV